jgi:outer membrane beta-barrel protein
LKIIKIIVLALVTTATFPQAASADEIDDILNEDVGGSTTVSQERVAVEADADRGEEKEEDGQIWVPAPKRVIKTLQAKRFMKIGRFEASPHVGFVTNDPFIRRTLFGVNLAYNPTEVFAIEVNGTLSPDFGDADKKAITQQITENNQVTPDISKILWYSTMAFQFSPIYGKIAVRDRAIINFDIFGLFGAGVVGTRDDLEVLQKQDDPLAQETEKQIHPALTFGGGLRVVFSKTLAFRIEGRGLSYIETLESTTLELKNNVTFLAGVSFFFPGMK